MQDNTIHYNNKVIICVDCNIQFIFTEGEQKYYIEQRLAEPKRCPSCRRIRRLNKEDTSDRKN
jgi:hypothetical protein